MPLESIIKASDNAPVSLTDAAVRALRELSSEQGTLLRVAVKGGGCAGFEYDIVFDTARETDSRYEHNSVPYLIDPVSERYVRGAVLDYDKFRGFIFTNPNAIGSCGCGHSFTVD